MADLCPCCIPFCRRTAARAGKFEHCTEIICGKHWRLARAGRRRTYKRLQREWDRDPRPWPELPPGPMRARRVKLMALLDRLWAALRREVIERSAGIA